MTKIAQLLIASWLLGWIGLMAPTLSLASPKCYWTDKANQAVCAPPFGHILFDINRKQYFCGSGQCVIDSTGQSQCSSLPGGAAIIDSKGRALCVGGCQAPVKSLCVVPTP